MEKNEIFNAGSSFTNFEILEYYRMEPRFNGVCSRNNFIKK